MPPFNRHVAAGLAALLLATAGCERGPGRPPVDTGALPDTALVDTAGAAGPVSTWDPGAGPILVVAGEAPEVAAVVFPQYTDETITDTTVLRVEEFQGLEVDLFSRAGAAGSAVLGARVPVPGTEGCFAWPGVAVSPTGGGALPAWSIGFVKGRAETIPLDSIESMARADSARLAAEVARLASTLPSDTARAFRGIPFFVRTARRFKAAPDVDALIADVSRRINSEANPREEQIFLVAERDSGQTSGRYATVYFERASGREDSVETHEVLAAVLAGRARRTTLVIGRDDGEGVAYALLERTGPRTWRVRWTSAYTGC